MKVIFDLKGWLNVFLYDDLVVIIVYGINIDFCIKKVGVEIEMFVCFFGEDGKEILLMKENLFVFLGVLLNLCGENIMYEFVKVGNMDIVYEINGLKVVCYGNKVYFKMDIDVGMNGILISDWEVV